MLHAVRPTLEDAAGDPQVYRMDLVSRIGEPPLAGSAYDSLFGGHRSAKGRERRFGLPVLRIAALQL